ncbi:type II secretion system F family protein [Paenibacillus silviterrae]|uniref:type II secretion system F family protein n=1 Tax=Paenibacillus silviterrae TaxID=3242194 RepID=UPI0025430689|nr:type II secretion system F family protein [Paenibacillus chinjuensis]
MSLQLLVRASAKPAADAAAKGSLPDYRQYALSTRQRFLSMLIGWAFMGVTAWIFYKSFWMVLLFIAAGSLFPEWRRRQLLKNRRAQLQLQFQQLMASLSSSLGAGKSIESAFAEALADLRLLYTGTEAMIIRELEIILRRMENGETIERALASFSERAQLDDIRQFTEVFITCKRTGGNLVQVMRRTSSIIQDKLAIQQDIQVLLSQKRLESRVLSLAPVVMIAVLGMTTPDYMEPMYSGVTGRLIMSFALLVFAACFVLTNKIMDIRV